VTLEWHSKSLTDASRGIIYDCNIFIEQATEIPFILVMISNEKNVVISNEFSSWLWIQEIETIKLNYNQASFVIPKLAFK
jgi:hypothetical protein